MTCSVTDEEYERFIDGTSDELVDHVAECPTCQARIEASIGSPSPITVEQTMRAIRIHSFTKGAIEAAVDVSSRFAKSAVHYLLKG